MFAMLNRKLFGAKESGKIVQFHFEKEKEDFSLLTESPFRILKVAERGDAEEFRQIVTCDIKKLDVRDNRGRSAVHQAALNNNTDILEIIVSCGGDLNASDFQGNTALHIAVEGDAVESVEILLRNKANAKLCNGNIQTPVHLCCTWNKPTCLAIMARFPHLIDVHQGDEHGRTALHIACIFDHEECVKILLGDLRASPRKVCSHKFFPIHEAAKHGSSRSLGALLTMGSANGCPREDMILFYDAEGNAPLHSAVHGGDSQTVKLCLLSGAKISIQQQDLSTAVHLACSQGALEIVRMMFTIQPEEKETALQACDLERMTPLHCAAMYDHSELVEYLVSEGACLDTLDKNRNSPLQLAASRKAWNAAKVLLRHGADARLEDIDGRSFLHLFVKYSGNFETDFEQFAEINKVVNVDAKDKKGLTPLHLAGKYGNLEGLGNLLTFGANVFAQNLEGENVFHVACKYGRLAIVQKILKMDNANAIINEGNGNGLTPFHIAAQGAPKNELVTLESLVLIMDLKIHVKIYIRHCEILKLLMSKGALLHRDYDGCTPIHLAAKNGHYQAMKLIFSTHSHLVDLVDTTGNTPLHVAAYSNQARAVSLLLKLGCRLTYNDYGLSAVDYALQNNFVDVVSTMVTDPNRGNDILGMTEGRNPFIMTAIVAKMPSVAKTVLDQNVVPSDTKADAPRFHIKYNFKWFSHPAEDELVHKVEDCLLLKTKQKLPPEKIFVPVLNEMVAHKRVDLLSHELCRKYLQMKWDSCGKYFQILNLFLYMIYLTLVTSYAISPWTKDEQFIATWNDLHDFQIDKNEDEIIQDILASNETILPLAPTSDVAKEEIDFFNYLRFYYDGRSVDDIQEVFDFAVVFKKIAVLIFSISSAMIILEVVRIWRYGIKYCMRFDTWVWYGVNSANFAMGIIQWLKSREYVNPSAALAAFLSWFYLLLILQRFDLVGIYVSMFLEILRSLLRVLLIFSVLIIAFGLSFYILLSNGNHLVFTDIPLSIMRTFSMMLGDLDFMNTFGFPHHCQLMESLNMTGYKIYTKTPECKSSRRIPYPIMSFTMVGLYMLLNCILLVNMLIGLAVGDIDSVKRNAQLKRFTMQVQMQTNLEKTIPRFILRRLEKPFIVEYPNQQERKLNLMQKVVEFFHPKSPPSVEAKELVQYSNEILKAVEETTETVELLRSDLEFMKSSMAAFYTKLNTIAAAVDSVKWESTDVHLELNMPVKRCAQKRSIRKSKIVREYSLTDSD